jgi:hypothetical protein
MKILAAALSAAIAIAVLSGCAYDRYGNERNAIRNGQNDNSNENRDLPAKVFDLIGRP